MALVPGGSLPPKNGRLKVKEGGRDMYVIKERIKVYFIYWVAGVYVVELLSGLVYNNTSYMNFWYPLLTQIQVLVLLGAFITHGKVLNFCKAKMHALYGFSFYYLMGIVSLIFQINSPIYLNVSYGVLFLVGGIFCYNMITNKK